MAFPDACWKSNAGSIFDACIQGSCILVKDVIFEFVGP